MTIRHESRWLWAVLALGLSTSTVLAQAPTAGDAQTPSASPAAQATTRLGLIEFARRQKDATLWPERESPLVGRVNRLMDRGLIEGIRTGEGNNGWQLLLAGTRPAQGQTYGIGYRRSDLFNDLLTARVTARGTFAGAQLYDGELQVNRLRRSKDTFVNVYAKYERSPHMDYYGLGANSRKEDRTRYQLNTASIEGRAGYRFTRSLNAGIDLGYGGAHNGPSTTMMSRRLRPNSTRPRRPVSSTTPRSPRGVRSRHTTAATWCAAPGAAASTGSSSNAISIWMRAPTAIVSWIVEGQQFFPYLNQQRVVALFVKARFAYTGRDDRVVPFYLLPELGGNFELRGFNQYRFSDSNAFMAALEHRWYAFSGLEMALFVDAGKTVPEKGRVDFSDLNYSGGIGMRVRVRGAVVLRMDVATSREGTRWIWSMSDVSRRRF